MTDIDIAAFDTDMAIFRHYAAEGDVIWRHQYAYHGHCCTRAILFCH